LHIVELHRDLLQLRREDQIFAAQRSDWLYGAVLGPAAFLLRFFGEHNDHRLILVNLGTDIRMDSIAEPLLAPPADHVWELLWTSEDPRYGGSAPAPVDELQRWTIPGCSTSVLKPASWRDRRR
jgi:maltooligosyltrehalose trehalohydrolase